MTESFKKVMGRKVDAPTDFVRIKCTRFSGSTSSEVKHEVGNLINNVGLTLSTLKKERLSPEAEKAIAILEKESQRVKGLIYNSLQSGKKPKLQLASQPMDSIIRDVILVHKPDALRRGVRLSLHWASRLPCVQVDIHLMHQVLNNLVKNSLEAITGAGTIRIEGSCDQQFLMIKVKDTGVGIGPDALQCIFDPFFTTKGERGTGLGLAIVKTIVEAHGGTIECQSDLAKGTCFTLRLPQR